MRSLARLTCCLGSLVCSATAWSQTTWFVDAAAAPPGNGTPESPYASIQFAHDQASTQSGDILAIAPGDYAEPLHFAQGKALTLAGAGASQTRVHGELFVVGVPGVTRVRDLGFSRRVDFDASDVELDGVHLVDVPHTGTATAIRVINASSTWSDVVVSASECGAATLFNGQATLQDCSFLDGTGPNESFRVVNVDLTMTNCRFVDNHHSLANGGALNLFSGSFSLVDCEFIGNSSTLGGGAIVQASGQLSISGGLFASNESNRGGALYLLGDAILDDVTFEANVARNDLPSANLAAQGGAIYVTPTASLAAENCRFLDNSASAGPLVFFEDHHGGAIFAADVGSSVTDSLFSGNFAGQAGSAVFGPLELVRCSVRDGISTDAGGALHRALLERCSVVSNAAAGGSAAVVDSTVANSIVWANAGAQLGGTSSATFSCIQGGAAGAGNIADDPLFSDLLEGDLSLMQGSPCIDAAHPAAPLDADLTPADMGAMPFTWQPIGSSYCSTNPNSSGQTASIAALGSTSVADDFLRVQAIHTAVDQVGLFMMSQNQGFVPFFNGSQGNLCVSAPIFRLTNTPGSVSSSGALGLLNLRVGLNTLPAGLQILPGQTWHFQSWFRDHVGGNSTSNTSNAVSVTFQ